MKKIILAAIIIAPNLVFAQVLTKSVYNCTYWTHQNGYYVCGSYPFSEQTVDAMSLNMKIRELENRIAELEKKIGNN